MPAPSKATSIRRLAKALHRAVRAKMPQQTLHKQWSNLPEEDKRQFEFIIDELVTLHETSLKSLMKNC